MELLQVENFEGELRYIYACVTYHWKEMQYEFQ